MEAGEWQEKLMEWPEIDTILNVERFFSRRNEVYKVYIRLKTDKKLKVVVKVISSAGKSQEEVGLLQYLLQNGIKVPQVIWYEPGIIVLEYIQGTLLADLLVKEQARNSSWIKRLAVWLASYHRLTLNEAGKVLLIQDANLRNFIYYESEFYGIDFESKHWGDPARDLGELCSFILNNDPSFVEWKFAMVEELIRYYQQETGREIEKKVWGYIIQALEETIKRRPQQEKVLREGIKTIKIMGKLSLLAGN